MNLKDQILSAARADAIPEGKSGLWFVWKMTFDTDTPSVYREKPTLIPAGTYTHLHRMTEGTMHLETPGVCVMEDTPQELNSHLDFMMGASGRVLVAGLGLGCVVRGLLANEAVTQVTVIENSQDVLKLVAPYVTGGRHDDRLLIVYADALAWTEHTSQTFDCAWYDLWTCQEEGQPHLDHWHTRLLLNMRGKVGRQGAWSYHPRLKAAARKLFNWIG